MGFSSKFLVAAAALAAFGTVSAAGQELRNSVDAQSSSVQRQLRSIERMKTHLMPQGRGIAGDGRGNPSGSFFNSPAPARLQPVAVRWDCGPVPEGELSSITADAAQANDIPQDLLRSVIKQESASHACAVSSKGAMGLMQLMPATAATLGVKNPFDARENVAGGARFLRQLLEMFKGDLPMALGAYNAGPNNHRLAMGLPLPLETLNYIDRVMAVYHGE